MIKLLRPCKITVGFTPKMWAVVAYDSVRDSELGEDLFCDIHNDATWRWSWQLSDDRVRECTCGSRYSVIFTRAFY